MAIDDPLDDYSDHPNHPENHHFVQSDKCDRCGVEKSDHPQISWANLVANDNHTYCGIVTHWNPHGVGEAIVQFFDGSADSCLFKELNFPNGTEAARKYLNDRERRRN